jgi:hypothetical protein
MTVRDKVNARVRLIFSKRPGCRGKVSLRFRIGITFVNASYKGSSLPMSETAVSIRRDLRSQAFGRVDSMSILERSPMGIERTFPLSRLGVERLILKTS